MKKIIYIILLLVTTSFSIVSCTEEAVEPIEYSSGGSGSTDKPDGLK